MFDIFGKTVAQFYLLDPQSNSNITISECSFWGNGVAVLTSDMTIFVAEVLKGFTELQNLALFSRDFHRLIFPLADPIYIHCVLDCGQAVPAPQWA